MSGDKTTTAAVVDFAVDLNTDKLNEVIQGPMV